MNNNLLMAKIKEINLNIFRVIAARYKNMNLDVTPIQGKIIMEIFDSNIEVCQKDIEGLVSCKKSTLSEILKTMEKNGYIFRKGSVNDSRRNIILLTNKSIEIANKLKDDMKKINKLLCDNITKDEYIIFSEVLDKINTNLERI